MMDDKYELHLSQYTQAARNVRTMKARVIELEIQLKNARGELIRAQAIERAARIALHKHERRHNE